MPFGCILTGVDSTVRMTVGPLAGRSAALRSKMLAVISSFEHYPVMKAIPFVPFEASSQAVSKTRSRLPHWSRSGATHFVTFRLADSIPLEAMARWKRRRSEWLALRGVRDDEAGWFRELSRDEKREYRRLFGASFESLVDEGHGECFLGEEGSGEILSEALHHFDGERYLLGDFVVMPNHVHVLVIPLGEVTLQSILRSWKSYTGREINRRIGREGALWQRESFDHLVRNRRQLEKLIDYIADNPSKAGLVCRGWMHYQDGVGVAQGVCGSGAGL